MAADRYYPTDIPVRSRGGLTGFRSRKITTEDNPFSAPAIVKKGVQKAGNKLKAGINVPRLQQAVYQGLFDDGEEFTPVKDMDEVEDIPVPAKIQHVMPSVLNCRFEIV